jgi:hypothetical protein
MCITPALRNLRQEVFQFEASLGNYVRCHLKKPGKTKTQQQQKKGTPSDNIEFKQRQPCPL